MALTRSNSQHSLGVPSTETNPPTQHEGSRSPSRDIEEILYGRAAVVENPDETIIVTHEDKGTSPMPEDDPREQQTPMPPPPKISPPSLASLNPPFTGYISAEEIEYLGSVVDHKNILTQQITIWT
ncbi:hypothetical protein BGW38_010022, partial [Lunasporangiospora selenospora]